MNLPSGPPFRTAPTHKAIGRVFTTGHLPPAACIYFFIVILFVGLDIRRVDGFFEFPQALSQGNLFLFTFSLSQYKMKIFWLFFVSRKDSYHVSFTT